MRQSSPSYFYETGLYLEISIKGQFVSELRPVSFVILNMSAFWTTVDLIFQSGLSASTNCRKRCRAYFASMKYVRQIFVRIIDFQYGQLISQYVIRQCDRGKRYSMRSYKIYFCHFQEGWYNKSAESLRVAENNIIWRRNCTLVEFRLSYLLKTITTVLSCQ